MRIRKAQTGGECAYVMEITGNAHGFNTALMEVAAKQKEFLGG